MIGVSVLPKLPYNIDRDLQPVVHMYGTPNLLAVTISLPRSHLRLSPAVEGDEEDA